MSERGITDVDLRLMLERASGWLPSVVPGRFMIGTMHRDRPWLVIVEPDPEERRLVIVTVFKRLP